MTYKKNPTYSVDRYGPFPSQLECEWYIEFHKEEFPVDLMPPQERTWTIVPFDSQFKTSNEFADRFGKWKQNTRKM